MSYTGKAISACGNKSAAKNNLKYKGDFMDRGNELAKLALEDNPDFIYICDWAPVKMQSLADTLKSKHYVIYLPNGFKNEKEKWRWTCISAIAIREDVVFSQTYLDEAKFLTKYRYISGVIQKEHEDAINILGVHIPQVDAPNERQLSRKRNMLNAIRGYMVENRKNRALVFGDFNCGPIEVGTEAFYCQREFDNLLKIGWHHANDTDEKTFNNKKIDHCFVSPVLVSKGEYNVNMILNNNGYKNFTDHKILDIKIS